jgi:uncharacterized protein YbjT (DUF2867 family)
MILVTGATGHVGRAVVSGLASSLGHDVVAMVRTSRPQEGASHAPSRQRHKAATATSIERTARNRHSHRTS